MRMKDKRENSKVSDFYGNYKRKKKEKTIFLSTGNFRRR
jgi:restriction endonuclease Mrr